MFSRHSASSHARIKLTSELALCRVQLLFENGRGDGVCSRLRAVPGLGRARVPGLRALPVLGSIQAFSASTPYVEGRLRSSTGELETCAPFSCPWVTPKLIIYRAGLCPVVGS
jgi:hypothetical protein